MSRSLELDVITAQMKLVNDCLGEWKAQVLFVCLRLGVFESLRDVPKGLAQLAQESSLPQDSLGRLLLGAVSAGFLALDEQQRFDLPTACRLVLLRGQAGYLGNYLELMSRWYDSFGKLEQAVRQDGAVEDPNHGAKPSRTLPT